MRPILLLAMLAALACGKSPAQPQTQTNPAASVVQQAPKSESITRADALLEDFKNREAAQAKFDRDNPARAAVPSLPSSPASRPAPSPVSVASPAATNAPASAANTAGPDPGHDEKWWKDQLRPLQQALDDALKGLAEAEKNNLKYGYNDAQAIYKKQVAAVAAARQAIDQLHDEARRAGVPPAWLR